MVRYRDSKPLDKCVTWGNWHPAIAYAITESVAFPPSQVATLRRSQISPTFPHTFEERKTAFQGGTGYMESHFFSTRTQTRCALPPDKAHIRHTPGDTVSSENSLPVTLTPYIPPSRVHAMLLVHAYLYIPIFMSIAQIITAKPRSALQPTRQCHCLVSVGVCRVYEPI